jgi:hypothetical protein
MCNADCSSIGTDDAKISYNVPKERAVTCNLAACNLFRWNKVRGFEHVWFQPLDQMNPFTIPNGG